MMSRFSTSRLGRARSGSGVCIAASLLVLTLRAANAEPQRDISQLDLKSAQQSVTVSGFQIKVLPALSKSNGTGVLLGGQLVQFINELFFFGGGGYGGTLIGRAGQNGGFGYGGFIAGLEARPGDRLCFDIALLLGGGGGTPAPGDQASGFVVEPSLGIEWVPHAKGLRVGITGGYLFLPGSPSLSGFSIGFKLEFKAFNLSWPE
jgi:hypothetical protein